MDNGSVDLSLDYYVDSLVKFLDVIDYQGTMTIVTAL